MRGGAREVPRIFCCGNENVKTITRRPTRLAVLLRGRVWVLRRVFTSLCVFRAFHALLWRQTRQQRQLLNEGLLSDMYNKNLLGSMTSRRGRPRVAREARALRSSSKRARHRASHAFLVTSYGPEIGGKPGDGFCRVSGKVRGQTKTASINACTTRIRGCRRTRTRGKSTSSSRNRCTWSSALQGFLVRRRNSLFFFVPFTNALFFTFSSHQSRRRLRLPLNLRLAQRQLLFSASHGSRHSAWYAWPH